MSVRKKVLKSTTEGEQKEVIWWIADYADGAGTRHQRRFPTKKEALAVHDQIKVAIRAGTHVSLPDSLTMADVADKWLSRVEANAMERGTLKFYREHVNLHILPRIGKLKLAKLTKGHIEHFRAENLVRMMEDTDVPFGVRAKIAQDLLDRAGLIATQVHQIIPTTEDPIMRFFEEAFSDPNNWEENPTQPAIEERVIDPDVEPEEIADAEIVEPEGEPANDTPPRIAEMIKSGAFDRKPGQ